MKFIVALLALTQAFTAFAGNETQTFSYDGSQNSMMMNFRGEKTHTEYRTEQVPSTCWRTEIVGYQTICHGPDGLMDDPRRPGPMPRPYPGPGPVPRPRPPICVRQPVYRQVPYTCMQTVRTPFEVKDYDVDARIAIDVKAVTALNSVEKLHVNLNGDQLTLTAQGSTKYLIMLKKQNVQGNMNGSVKMIDASYSIELIEAAPILGSLSMPNIEINQDILTFDIGPVADRKNLGFDLSVVKKKTLASDIVLFDRELTSNEVTIRPTNRGSAVDVNVRSIGVNITSGKYGLTARAYFKGEGTLLNRSQFEAFEASRTLIYTIR